MEGKRRRAKPIRESPETAEMKCSVPAAAVVRQHLDLRFGKRGEPADLPAADAPAAFPGLLQPVLGQLPEVGVLRAGHDQFCRDIPLDPLEPGILGDEGFCHTR